MGAGLQRARAAAQAAQIKPEMVGEMRKFLTSIVEHGGAAKSSECPLAFWEQDTARKKAKSLGWVIRENGYWKITEVGRAALRNL